MISKLCGLLLSPCKGHSDLVGPTYAPLHYQTPYIVDARKPGTIRWYILWVQNCMCS